MVAVALAALAIGLWLGRRHRYPDRRAEPAAAGITGAPGARVDDDVVRRLLGAMRIGMVVVDSSDTVLLGNLAAHDLGVLRDGRIVQPEIQRLVRLARATGHTQDVTSEIGTGRARRDGRVFRLSVVPLDASGQIAVFLDDVSEARRLAAVRRDFVANISHELKTPVGALMLLSEAMEEASGDPDAVRRFATRMGQEGQRLARTIAELIDLSRLEGADPLPAPNPVSVDAVIAEALEQTRAAAESAGITIVAGGSGGLTVIGDHAQLTTAIVNLVGNAIAYSPPQTKVAVGSRSRTIADPDVRERYSTAGTRVDARANDAVDGPSDGTAYVEISVADRGIGIAESDLERIFERFYRADPARSRATGGTGLGLSIVKHIATNHGGDVQVWSVEGAGSTFTLRLPAVRQPGGTDAGAEDAAGGAGGAGGARPAAGRRPHRQHPPVTEGMQESTRGKA